MELTAESYMLMAMVLAVAAVLQGAAGFAFGLFAVPMLLVIGMMPEQAIPMVAACAMSQSMLGVWLLRRSVQWKLLAKVLPFALLTLPLGVWVLAQVAALEGGIIRQIFGCIVLVVLLLQWLWRVQPRDEVHTGWGMLAMATAGVTTGVAGMAGPPTAMWVTAYRWSSSQMRATMWAVFAVLTPPNVFFLSQRFGPVVEQSLWQGAVFVPMVLVATLPGIWLGNRMGMKAMRRVALTTLVSVATYTLVQPIFWPGLG